MKSLTGIGVSSGIAIGKVFLKENIQIKIQKEKIQDIQVEFQRLREAVAKSKVQVQKLYQDTLTKAGEEEAQIFDAHEMILEDEEFLGDIKERIEKQQINVEWALEEAANAVIEIFEAMDNEYMRARATDIRDVTQRLLRNLKGIEEKSLLNLDQPVIIIAEDLTPSDTAQMDKEKVLGFVTQEGGRTSHTAIMARSFEIPAIVGAKDLIQEVKDGDFLVFDGRAGILHVQPDSPTLEAFQEKKKEYEKQRKKLEAMKEAEAVSKDGVRFEVASNIGEAEEVAAVIDKNCDGIGLFRTEFVYMNRNNFPSEEEQFQVYKKVVEKMAPKPVVIRTFDIGGDKELDYLEFPKEMNPFLGCRAIRFCLTKVDLWKVQLRAILRASAYGTARMMFPMIASVEEWNRAKEILNEVKEELRKEQIPFDEEMEVGMMMETPAAAAMADIFAAEVDFFSIGTNDLIQYLIAVDRLNPHVSQMYSPFHPAVLRTIKRIIDAAHKEGIWVGMCGEAASDPKLIPILMGMGLDEFSMAPSSVWEAKWTIQQYSKQEMEEKIKKIFQLKTVQEIKEYIDTTL